MQLALPQTSVIVPTFNGAQKLPALINILLPQIALGRELIVVNDGSRDDTASVLSAQLLGHPYARLYTIENRGRSGARNYGVSRSSGSFIVFLDDDMEVSGSFLERMESIHRRHADAWITGTVKQKIVDIPHSDFLRFRSRLDYCASGPPCSDDGLVEVRSFTTQQLGVPRASFLRLGGFAEQLRDSEDFALSVRVLDAGQKIIHDSANIAYHRDFSDFHDFMARQSEYRKGRVALARAAPELVERFPDVFIRASVGRAASIVRRGFCYGAFWRLLFRSRFRFIIPEIVRHRLFDYVMSSTAIFANRKESERT